jgi:hypothetical protein
LLRVNQPRSKTGQQQIKIGWHNKQQDT